MPKLIDLTGEKFGRLTVVERDYGRTEKGTYWKCLCNCGNVKSVSSTSLKRGRVRSCGCLKDEYVKKLADSVATHRQTKTRLYREWFAMKQRCNYKKHKQFKNYGGRGISVCKEWMNSFESFRDWALCSGYNDSLTIDRIDVNGNYSPENCRWITHKVQQNNRTNNRYITHNGETKTLSEWCEIYNIKFSTLKHRLDDLKIPFDVAIKMDGLSKVDYCGRKISIRRLAQWKRVDYRRLLYATLINGENVETALVRLSAQSEMENQ